MKVWNSVFPLVPKGQRNFLFEEAKHGLLLGG